LFVCCNVEGRDNKSGAREDYNEVDEIPRISKEEAV